jgi:DNA sulfur modification protein DndC
LAVRCVRPRTSDRYFVKVIGRGYPPPSSIFRWCTDVLRIDPIRRFLQSVKTDKTVTIVGVRRGESESRDRIIRKHATSNEFFQRQVDATSTLLFCPIINYSLDDVWETLRRIEVPRAIDATALLSMYKDASAECPVIREAKGAPCGKGRFGCWTCTVVRRNKAIESLVDAGNEALEPLLRWRNWLQAHRDDVNLRCKRRRNGQPGKGPFKLRARKLILRKLRKAEFQSGLRLITKREIEVIKQLWRRDRESLKYVE